MKNTQKGARCKSQPNYYQRSCVFSEYFCSEMPGSSPAFRRACYGSNQLPGAYANPATNHPNPQHLTHNTN